MRLNARSSAVAEIPRDALRSTIVSFSAADLLARDRTFSQLTQYIIDVGRDQLIVSLQTAN